MRNTEETKAKTPLVGKSIADIIQAEQSEAIKQVEQLQERINALQELKGRSPGYYKQMIEDIINGEIREARCAETIDAIIHFSHEYGSVQGKPDDTEIKTHLDYIFQIIFTSELWAQTSKANRERMYLFLDAWTKIIFASQREWQAVQDLEYADVFFRQVD